MKPAPSAARPGRFHPHRLAGAVLPISAMIIFWLAGCSPAREADLLVPVRFVGTPAGLTVAATTADGIELRAAGTRSALRALAESMPVYRLDLSEAVPGEWTFPVTPESLALPAEITLRRIRPASLTVRVEMELHRELPITLRTNGKPAAGFSVVGRQVLPPAVRVRGPASAVGALETIFTKPVEIDGATAPVRKELTLELPAGITLAGPPGSPVGEIGIEERIVTRRLESLPVAVRNTDLRWEISPAVIHIEVKGAVSALATLAGQAPLPVFVDLAGMKPGVYVRRAVIPLPVGTTLVKVAPELFTVNLTVPPEAVGKGPRAPESAPAP